MEDYQRKNLTLWLESRYPSKEERDILYFKIVDYLVVWPNDVNYSWPKILERAEGK